MQTKKALGKGLASLMPIGVQEKINDNESENEIKYVPTDAVIPNRQQPRKNFDDESLKELADSIREKGIIQPLIVCPAVGGKYELVAGERRLRAAKILGLKEVPVIIKSVGAEELLEIALIENIQRENLNPIEEAGAFKALMEQFEYSQEEVSERVGKSRAAIANSVRLLNLPKLIQEDVIKGRMSAGHARALLSITDIKDQLSIRERVLNSQLTVRDIERMIQERLKGGKRRGRKGAQSELSPQMKMIVEEMKKALGTKVKIEQDSSRKRGRVVIEYYSPQELDKIYSKIVKTAE